MWITPDEPGVAWITPITLDYSELHQITSDY